MEHEIYYQVAARCNYVNAIVDKPIAFFDQKTLATDYERKLIRALCAIYPAFPIYPFPFSREDIQFLNKRFPQAEWGDLFYCESIERFVIVECEEVDIKL